MPRTKQPTKARAFNNAIESTLNDFNRLVSLKIKAFEFEESQSKKQLDTSSNMALNKLAGDVRNMTFYEILALDVQEQPSEEIIPKTPNISKDSNGRKFQSTKPKRATGISDDGYQSESLGSQASKKKLQISVVKKKRSVSSSRYPATVKKVRRSSSNEAKSIPNSTLNTTKKKAILSTPKAPTQKSFVITPKVKLNSVCNLMRKPKDGEMVFSTQGSPLMVSTTVSDKTANIQVPLNNGNIISLLPFNESIRESFHLDDETKDQLRILHRHLGKVLK